MSILQSKTQLLLPEERTEVKFLISKLLSITGNLRRITKDVRPPILTKFILNEREAIPFNKCRLSLASDSVANKERRSIGIGGLHFFHITHGTRGHCLTIMSGNLQSGSFYLDRFISCKLLSWVDLNY